MAQSSGSTHEREKRAPQVFIIGRPTFCEEDFGLFLRAEGEDWSQSESATPIENIIEAAGRLCYMSFGRRQSPKTNREYIAHLIRQGHESVLEHVSWTFILTGVSRSFTHQLVRHRVGFSFSQLSQQYHDARDLATTKPGIISESEALSKVWEESVAQAKAAYSRLLDALEALPHDRDNISVREYRRLIRSAARSVLPEGTETKIVVTANARSVRYLLKLRGGIMGDEEMRVVCSCLLENLKGDAPSLFADFRTELAADGRPVVRWTPLD
jgi:thymidylate synthase (FAD)